MKPLLASLAFFSLLLAGPAGGQERPYPRSQRPRSFLNTGLRLGHCPNHLSTCQSTGGCLTKSRTFDGVTQYFISANGAHGTLEPGAGTDFSAAMLFRTSAVGATQYIMYNGGDVVGRPGTYLRINPAGTLRCSYASASGTAATTGATTIVADTWYFAGLRADRDSVLDCMLAGVPDSGAPADISAYAAETLANSSPMSWGAFYNGSSLLAGRLALWAVWAGAGPDNTAWVAMNALALTGELTCSVLQATYSATACWPGDGAAGANELDQIGSVDLTQVNSPGSADGPGTDCN